MLILCMSVICPVLLSSARVLLIYIEAYNYGFMMIRSPWSNKYHPPLEDGTTPSFELRKLEIEANDVFAIYRDQ